MQDNYVDCRCGHSRRGHYGGSGRLRDAGTCKSKDCGCRQYAARELVVEPRGEIHA